MDGGLTDGSLEIIKKYEKYFSYLQSKPDNGQSAAINAGMGKASGEICCWLNSEDQLKAGSLNFDNSSFSKDRKWHDSHVDRMIQHYKFVKQFMDCTDTTVSNATIGGNLEVFDRVDYKKVLNCKG